MIYMHDNNIKFKIKSKYHKLQDVLQKYYDKEYLNINNKLSKLNFNSRDKKPFDIAAKIIEEYFTKIDKMVDKYKITPQSKFRSSFIEEISTYLFKDVPEISSNRLGIFNKAIYAGMKIKNNGDIDILKKDVDFCIGKQVRVTIDDSLNLNLIIPVIAVEAKTYLDSTMFGEVLYSSRMIKNATPQVKTYVLMEYNQVGDDKILAARHDNNLKEMFVLRENATSKIESSVLIDYYNEVLTSINVLNKEDNVTTPGRLIGIQ